MKLRLLSYNIRFGGVGREAEIASTIAALAPDVVLLQEANRPDVVKRLAETTGLAAWGASPLHSVGFLSRLDVREHAWHRPGGTRRSFLELQLGDTQARLFGVHLSAVHSNWTERRRVVELRALLAAIARHRDGPHVVTGDFNTLAPGERLDLARLPRRLQLLAWLGGRTIRWQTIQIMLDAGYLDAFRHLHPGDAGHTFPTWDPHVRIDYLFVPAVEVATVTRCEVSNGPQAAAASDHYPLLTELEL